MKSRGSRSKAPAVAAPAKLRDVVLVRFYRSGEVACLDANRQTIRELSSRGPVRVSRAMLPAIKERLAEDAKLVEQEWGKGWWPPLTERTLARFEGRAPVGDQGREVGL